MSQFKKKTSYCSIFYVVHPLLFYTTTKFCIVPGAPPRNVSGSSVSPTSIMVKWLSPSGDRTNGVIQYYKLYYVQDGFPDEKSTTVKLNRTQHLLDELKKWTEYRIWIVAGTSVGDGPPSYPTTVRTHEDGTYHNYNLYAS